MYPYRNRFRWFVFGRYSHLARALRDHQRDDPVLLHRIRNLRTWNTARFVISFPLSIGVVATLASAIATQLPGQAGGGLANTVEINTALTSILTVLYLFLTRLLGQLEIDILTILTLGDKK